MGVPLGKQALIYSFKASESRPFDYTGNFRDVIPAHVAFTGPVSRNKSNSISLVYQIGHDNSYHPAVTTAIDNRLRKLDVNLQEERNVAPS